MLSLLSRVLCLDVPRLHRSNGATLRNRDESVLVLRLADKGPCLLALRLHLLLLLHAALGNVLSRLLLLLRVEVGLLHLWTTSLLDLGLTTLAVQHLVALQRLGLQGRGGHHLYRHLVVLLLLLLLLLLLQQWLGLIVLLRRLHAWGHLLLNLLVLDEGLLRLLLVRMMMVMVLLRLLLGVVVLRLMHGSLLRSVRLR